MEEEINKAVQVLKNGGIIIYPTDTIWGIGCDATNPKAVKRIHQLKKRTEKKTFIVLVAHENQITDYADDVPEIAWDLLESYDKPLTIIYNNAKNLAKNLIREDSTIAMRVTHDEFSKRLVETFGKPIVSTSANFSGDKNPLTFKMISEEIKNGSDLVVDLYHNSMNEMKPSTIIKFHKNGEFEIIRS